MRNTTKLKHLLQLYVVSLDMDEEGIFYLTLVSKMKRGSATFDAKTYSAVMAKAFSYMVKQTKQS